MITTNSQKEIRELEIRNFYSAIKQETFLDLEKSSPRVQAEVSLLFNRHFHTNQNRYQNCCFYILLFKKFNYFERKRVKVFPEIETETRFIPSNCFYIQFFINPKKLLSFIRSNLEIVPENIIVGQKLPLMLETFGNVGISQQKNIFKKTRKELRVKHFLKVNELEYSYEEWKNTSLVQKEEFISKYKKDRKIELLQLIIDCIYRIDANLSYDWGILERKIKESSWPEEYRNQQRKFREELTRSYFDLSRRYIEAL